MNYLENLKESFIEMLEEATKVYKTMGTPYVESPMWFQLNIDDESSESLLFKSSQSHVWMRIACTANQKIWANRNFNDAYDFFKKIKYSYLKEHHPDVWEEVNFKTI